MGLTEFNILEKYPKSFNESGLGDLHSVFPFNNIAKEIGLSQHRLGRRNYFRPSAKITLMNLLREKKEEGFKDKDAEASDDQTTEKIIMQRDDIHRAYEPSFKDT